MLGAIVCIELVRAGYAWYVLASHDMHPAVILAPVFSIAVIAGVALLLFLVFIPADRALLAHMESAHNARERLARSEAWYRSIFDRHPNPAVALDKEGCYLRVNAAMETLSGFRESELLGAPIRMTPPEYLPRVEQALYAALQGQPSQFDMELVRKNGERRTISLDVIPMAANGVVEGMYAFSRDVTEAQRAQKREALQRDRLRAVAMLAAHESDIEAKIGETLDFAVRTLGMDAAHVGIVREGTMSIVAGSGQGYPSGVEVPLERTFSRHIIHTGDVLVIDDVRFEPWASDAARSWQPWGALVCAAVPIGSDRGAALVLVKRDPLVVFDEADRDFVVVVASLIGAHLARERQERQLAELAFVDGLTHLPNRAYFSEQMEAAIAQVRREGGAFAIHYVDLDGFKGVNDRHGHEAGDHVLTVIAARLKMAARLSDVVARHGGDEFIVLQRRHDGPIGASLLAQRLIDAAAEPIVIRDEIIRLGASVGIAVFPQDAFGADELLRCADAAMYRAKNAGRNRHELYA
jgi:diguanylate cyclase (GGDEF)-like protein/PAS domain S-box-containing protein